MSYAKRFERQIKETAEEDGDFIYRLRDTTSSFSRGLSFSVGNYSDFIYILDKYTIFIEVKTTQGKNLPFKNIMEAQLKGIEEVEKYKKKNKYLDYIFIVNFYKENKIYLIKGIDIYRYIETATRKSVPIKYFEEEGIEAEIKEGKRVLIDIKKAVRELYKKKGVVYNDDGRIYR